MPCRCEGYEDQRETDLWREADAATRAACELRTVLRGGGKESDLSDQTRKWIAQHDAEDAKRFGEEMAVLMKERAKKQALTKLTREERRALGL